MSGAEAAGFVLAAIPLVVSGLEHYGEGVRTIRRMRDSSTEFFKIKQALECEQHIFLNSLEIVLRDDVDDLLLGELIAHPHEPKKWLDPQIDECLQRRLGRSYESYLATAKAMGLAVQDFRDALQLGSDGKGPFTLDKRSVSDALRKIKFGLKMRSYLDTLDEISTCNKRLCQLTDHSSTLEPIRQSKRRAPDFERARDGARDIFNCLQNALVKSCNVKHKASLYMRPIELSGHSKSARSEHGRFRVVLHHLAGNQTQPPWVIKEAEIRPLREEQEEVEKVTSKLSRVQFMSPALPGKSSSQANSSTRARQEISDLCMSLKAMKTIPSECDDCLGYLLDISKGQKHGLYWPDRPLINSPSTNTILLADIFDGQHGFELTEPEKRLLALALASGMLRLYDTPWLPRQWGKREVLLFKKRDGIVASHPFISAEIPTAIMLPQSPSSSALPYTPCRLIKEETLFALGVMLIELAMEKTFEELRLPEDLDANGTKHQFSDYLTADRLVEEMYDVAGDRYGNVVRRCIRCQFDEQKNSLAEAAFRKKVYEGVVSELVMEVQDFQSL